MPLNCRAAMSRQKYELLVVLICPMIAGRDLRATRAPPRRPRKRKLPRVQWIAPRRSFRLRRRSPKLHSGPLIPAGGPPTRTTPTTNTRRKHSNTKGEGKTGIMEKLTITTPSDVLSFIGHTLGFWPQESLVCITLNANSIGATLRIDLPVINELNEHMPGVTTLSTTVTAEEMANMDETAEEVEAADEGSLHEVLLPGEAQARELRQLASLLDRRERLQGGRAEARAAVAADDSSAEGWEILGRALLKQEDYTGARDALEAARALDPTSLLTLMMLALCYERLGDGAHAREFRARATSLTGGDFAG
jgi:hypothetical protein